MMGLSEMVQAIKGKRRMSLDHWRFRLLHYSLCPYRYRDIKKPEDSGLPRALYTHYCPLFHVTNLLVIAFPFLLTFRTLLLLATTIFRFTGALLTTPAVGLYNGLVYLEKVTRPYAAAAATYVESCIPKPSEEVLEARLQAAHKKQELKQAEKDKAEKVRLQNLQRDLIPKYLSKAAKGTYDKRFLSDFSIFWTACYDELRELGKKETKEIWVRWVNHYNEYKQAAEAKKKARAARLAFWVNFSRIFFKCGLNISYAILAALVAWLVYFVTPYVWAGLCWFFAGITTISWSYVFSVIAVSVALGATILGATFFLVYYVFPLLFRVMVAYKVWTPFTFPFVLGWSVIKGSFGYLESGMRGLAEFVSLFYEDNCPPVEIVSAEEEEIERLAER